LQRLCPGRKVRAMTARPPSGQPLLPDAIDDWIFDLDNTLYPASSNLFGEIERRIIDYIRRHLALETAAALELKQRYREHFGSSMRGLMDEHGVDPVVFMNYVHDIDVTMIAPDRNLDQALARLPGRKLIFTNASTRHAENVLKRLGIGGHFAEIFDITAAGYVPKPQPAAYRTLVERHAIDPARAVFVEDLAINLAPAAALGMTTVWIAADGEGGSREDGGEAAAGHVHHTTEDLAAWLAEVIDGPGGGER